MPTIARPGSRGWLRGLGLLGLALGLLAGCATGGTPAPSQTSSRAPAPAPAAAPAPAPAPTPVAWGHEGDLALGPPLWQVEGRSGAALFLFGTMHSELATSVSPQVWERLRAARTLAFEADVAALGTQAVLAKAVLPPGESLDTMLGAEAWARLRDYLKSTVPEAALVRLRPWFVVTLVVVKASGFKPGDQPMDLGLMQAGRDAGKTLHFLESADEQIDLLARTFDAKTLAAMATKLDAVPELLQQMSTAYRKGDLRAIEAIMTNKEYRHGLGEEEARLLLGARNERWLPFVEKLAAEGGGFVAVGVGHIPGADGLVALLRTRGYQVTRVPAAR